MKTKRFIITILEPCTENWNEMTPTARGKFCAHCQKDVIDFSNKTDSEITNFVKNNKGNFCGRFVDTQLDKEFSYIESEKKSTLKYAAALALGLLTAENAVSQDEKTKIEMQPINSIKNTQIKIESDTTKKELTFNKPDYSSLRRIVLGGVQATEVKSKPLIIIDGREVPFENDETIFDILRRTKP